MTFKQLVDTATRHQVHLERLKSGLVQDFQAFFGRIDNTVVDILNSLRVDKLSELSRTKLEGVLTNLQTAQVEGWDKGVAHFFSEMPGVAEFESQFAAKELKSILVPKGRDKVVAADPVKAYKEALRRPVQATGAKVEDLVNDWTTRAIRRMNGAVRNGYEQGQTVPQIIKRLTGTKPLHYKDGVTAINKRHAATVVRTSVQHIAATAREVTYEENNDLVEGVVWVSTLDSHTTIQCQALDGHKFPLDEGPRPPIHPNCRSTTVPDLVDEFDFLDEGATRSSSGGYVAAKETYYDWLKKQSDSFQDSVIGPTRGQLLRDGGLTSDQFAALQLDKQFQPMTLDEMKKLAPLAFQRAGLSHSFDPHK